MCRVDLTGRAGRVYASSVHRRASFGCFFVGVLLGCSSTDAPGGASDAGADGSRPDDMLMRRDAQMPGDDPIASCQRFDPLACAAGEECKVLIRRAPGDVDFTIYEGCVEPRNERGPGDPCEAFGGLVDPYRIEGLVDEVHVDPCTEGYFCAPDPELRGLSTCQPACATSSLSGYSRACSGDGEYCSSVGPYQQTCIRSDGCDPADPSSCGAGSGCYLRLGDDAASVLSVCLPAPTDPVADGDSCIDAATGTYFLNACNPGSHCWGPVTVPPARWAEADYICRRGCTPGAGSGADAGDEDDAGTPDADGCGSGLQCVDFTDSGLDVSAISASFGNCE